MNAQNMLFITAIIVSTVFLTVVALFAGLVGALFGFIVVAAVLLRFASFLGFFNIPPLARTLNSGAMVCALIVIIIVGISRQIFFTPSPVVKEPSAAPQPATYQLCADGDYNFSNLDIKKVGEVVIKISPTCLANVVLPDSCWQSDPSVDVEKIWADGSKSYDGPNMLVIGKNNGKRIFFVRGLRESGIMKITFEKQV